MTNKIRLDRNNVCIQPPALEHGSKSILEAASGYLRFQRSIPPVQSAEWATLCRSASDQWCQQASQPIDPNQPHRAVHATLGPFATMFHVTLLKAGADPYRPRVARPYNHEKLQSAVERMLLMKDMILHEAPSTARSFNPESTQQRLQGLSNSLELQALFREGLALVESDIAHYEQSLSGTVVDTWNLGQSVFVTHVILQERLQPVADFISGAQQKAQETQQNNRKTEDRVVKKVEGALAADSAAAAPPTAPAAGSPPSPPPKAPPSPNAHLVDALSALKNKRRSGR